MEILFKALVGSRAYGVYNSNSDYDWRGVLLYPLDMYLGIEKVSNSKKYEVDTTYYEITHFLRMCVGANPNILEILFSPYHYNVSSYGQKIIDIRNIFLTKKVFYSYRGYYQSEYQNQKNGSKSRYHVIRIQLLLLNFLKKGKLDIVIPEEMRDVVFGIKNSELNSTFYYYYSKLEEQIQYYWVLKKETFADHVEVDAVNKLLKEIKLSYV